MNFTAEQIAKAKASKSAEELLAYAEEIGCKLTEEEAKYYFEQWHKEGELADEELDNVAGGTCYGDGWDGVERPIVSGFNTCGYFQRLDVTFDVNCSNCWFYSGRVNGKTISGVSGWCTHPNRIKGRDKVNSD